MPHHPAGRVITKGYHNKGRINTQKIVGSVYANTVTNLKFILCSNSDLATKSRCQNHGDMVHKSSADGSTTDKSTDRKVVLYAALGLLLSSYELYVDPQKMGQQPPAEEFSGLSDSDGALGANCGSTVQIPEGRLLSYFGIVPFGSRLDIPNAALGLVYYSLWLTMMAYVPKPLRLLISSLAMASSLFLAIQLLILSQSRILCWSAHVINAKLWWDAYNSSAGMGSGAASGRSNDRGKANIKRV